MNDNKSSDLERFEQLMLSPLGTFLKEFTESRDCPAEYAKCFQNIRSSIESSSNSERISWEQKLVSICNSIANSIGESPISYLFLQFSHDIYKINRIKQQATTFTDYLNELTKELKEYLQLIPDNYSEFVKFDAKEQNLPKYFPDIVKPEAENITENDKKLIAMHFESFKTDNEIMQFVDVLRRCGEITPAKSNDFTLTFHDLDPYTISQLKKQLMIDPTKYDIPQ